ncbi:MAG: hypothetical protein KDK70_07530, partial [Myxococcales bacterium]|nr:hypothetical protein [Myxococcales bacterium]
VCGFDPFCCSNTWDDICADHAAMECVLCGGGSTGGSGGMGTSDCCMANSGVAGCDDATCEVAVCSVDAFCCNNEWDQICADQAQVQCPALCP